MDRTTDRTIHESFIKIYIFFDLEDGSTVFLYYGEEGRGTSGFS